MSSKPFDNSDPFDLHFKGHNPTGCRYIIGDTRRIWRFCQEEIVPGGRPGSAGHPPYCEKHLKRCCPVATIPFDPAKYRQRLGNIDRNILDCGPDRNDGQRMPADIYAKTNKKGTFQHD